LLLILNDDGTYKENIVSSLMLSMSVLLWSRNYTLFRSTRIHPRF